MTEQFYHLGLVGWPLDHSLSPRLHHAALQALALQGEYKLHPIAPSQAGILSLAQLVERLRRGELQGLNVTIPHKQNVMPLLDRLTPAAQEIGAVNTIVCQDGVVVGDNTDAPGFMLALKKAFPWLASPALKTNPEKRLSRVARSEALILGAGGSARAVVYALRRAGWSVSLAARRVSQAQELANSFRDDLLGAEASCPGMTVLGEIGEALHHRALPPFTLIVNTTPLGMWPDVDTCPWPEDVLFPPASVLYDLVYNPVETKLVRLARLYGLQASSGIGMLVEQAALAFKCWTGMDGASEPMARAAQEVFGAVDLFPEQNYRISKKEGHV